MSCCWTGGSPLGRESDSTTTTTTTTTTEQWRRQLRGQQRRRRQRRHTADAAAPSPSAAALLLLLISALASCFFPPHRVAVEAAENRPSGADSYSCVSSDSSATCVASTPQDEEVLVPPGSADPPAEEGELEKSASSVAAASLGAEQLFPGWLTDDQVVRMRERLEESGRYVQGLPERHAGGEEDGADDVRDALAQHCRFRSSLCLLWSVVQNKCEDDPDFMAEECGPACQTCEMDDDLPEEGSRAHRLLESELVRLGADLGAVQHVWSSDEHPDVLRVLDEARSYLRDVADPAADGCFLRHTDCAHWALQGSCDPETEDGEMAARLCAPLCRSCDREQQPQAAEDEEEMGRRPALEVVINTSLGSEWGEVQTADLFRANDDGQEDDAASLDALVEFLSKLRDDQSYVEEYEEQGRIEREESPNDHGDEEARCLNQDSHCSAWALRGECEANAKFMSRECPVACRTCDRCRKDPDESDVWSKQGDQDRMFESILTNPEFQVYQPRALSRPYYAPGDSAETAPYQIGMWLVQLDSLLSEEEAGELLEVVQVLDFYASEVLTGFENNQAVNRRSEHRTSHQTWCDGECEGHPAHRRMIERVSLLTGIPKVNFEHTQIPRYHLGDQYKRHHDLILTDEFLSYGPRILTAFVYLNDVEEGGGTEFPVLNITATPKPGRAILWPSVLNEQPNTLDPRADHAALPVVKGYKVGANVWLHQRDFRRGLANDCA